MKNSLLLAILTVFVFMITASAESSKAPDFDLSGLDGSKVSLSSQKGKVVFLDFWASWCPPCRASIPEVEKNFEQFKDKNVSFYGINLDNDPATARDFVKKKGMKYTVLLGNDKVGRDYEIRGIPAFFIIDQEGNIAGQYVGFSPGMGSKWSDKINTLLASSQKPEAKNQKKKK